MSRRIPTTDIPKRLCAIMHRRLTTPWSEREYRQYMKLIKTGAFRDATDLELVERYYIFERKRGEKGFHRRDLLTLLNRWPGEVDRATEWAERHPTKPPPRKIIPLPPTISAPLILTDEDRDRMARFDAERKARKRAS